MKLKAAIRIIIVSILILNLHACHKPVPISPSEGLSISYKVPGDPGRNATQRELANFAWEEFFALNWKASWTANSDSMVRGKPDVDWSLATSEKAPDLTVWETYIHRAELRPANGIRYETDLNEGKPFYTFKNPLDTATNHIDLSQYWVNLDEDNEIGSCYLFAYDSLQVLYMAKTNLIEYNYVRDKFPDDGFLFRAGKVGADTAYLKNMSKEGLSCNSDTASHVICLPCGDENGEGAIEIKTAWRQLTTKDTIEKFLTREAVYYISDEDNENVVAHTGTFGLIGMHIIQKTKNYPAFVFASWEQVDVRMAEMKTIGLDQVKIDSNLPTPVIERDIPEVIKKVNSEVKSLVRSKNANSVWQYYQLIGVQGIPIDYKDKSNDPNYFMANYVVESDSLLTYFHGSFKNPFDQNLKNVIYNGKSFNMGGCQGCHGQAQIKGSDFSFLLDFSGSLPVKTPDTYLTFEQGKEKAHTPEAVKQVKDFVKKYESK